MKALLALVAALAITSAPPAYAQGGMGLQDYLEQVKAGHQGYKGAESKAAGAAQRTEEGALQFAPAAYTEVVHVNDQREPTNTFSGDQTTANKLSIGLSQNTSFGLNGKVYYSTTQTEISGIDPNILPNNKFSDSSLNVEFTQSLWKNGFGRDNRLQMQAAEATAQAAAKTESYAARTILSDAENVFWRLAAAQEQVRIQTESYDRSKKIADWQKKRASQNLSDDADLLQALAALKMRELELKNATNERRLALKAFNEMRSKPDTTEVGPLPLPNVDVIIALKLPNRAPERADLAAARLSLDASKATMEISREKQKPTLDLFGTASMNGKDPEYSEASSESFAGKYPYYTVGLRLSVPLTRGIINSSREGYAKEIAGAQLSYEQKKYDNQNQWEELVQKLADAKERLKVITELEQAQKLKFEAERKRQSQGRSTSYQIFLFEQDYLNAQLSRVQAAALVLTTYSQIKTFEVK